MIRTIAKHRYFKGRNAKRSLRQYVNYIAYRAGADKVPGGRLFFDRHRESISSTQVQHVVSELDARGIVAHELILSPGIQSVDQETYTRELMNKLKRSKGQELEWFASAHKGNHNHIHVLINARDAKGGYVRFSKEDYRRLRDWGDLYLERNHELERYLHKSVDLEKEFERDHGDELFESLFRADNQGQLESTSMHDHKRTLSESLYPQDSDNQSDDALNKRLKTREEDLPFNKRRDNDETRLFEDEEHDEEKRDDRIHK